MKKAHSNHRFFKHKLHRYLLIIIFTTLFFCTSTVAQAEEEIIIFEPTEEPQAETEEIEEPIIIEEEDETEEEVVEEILIETEEIIENIEEENIVEETPTSTEENLSILEESTVTSTPEIETPASTPTSTLDLEIETPTSTPTSTEFSTSADPAPEIENNNGSISQSGNTNGLQNQELTPTEINNAVNKILSYLKSQQDETGKIVDGTITDWAIISFGANNQYADEIKNSGDSLLDYEKKYNLDDSSDLNSCASYPRHILALLAAGVAKDDPAIQGLKNKIFITCYQNNLYGLNGINDDIFGLLGLLAIDVSVNEPIIIDIINTIKADQNAEGAFTWTGWAGADMTGAALNALKYAENKGITIEQNIYTNAKKYLKSTQLADGGWGYVASDVLTTSWVLMGLNALGENQTEWQTATNTNPWQPLVKQLKNEGFYESTWVLGTVDWFAMKHAVPALLGKSWPIILPAKVQNFSSGGGLSYIEPAPIILNIQTPTTTPTITTTTLEFTTTTMGIATSTLDFVTTTLEITTTTEEIIVKTETITENDPIEKLKIAATPLNQYPTIPQQKPQLQGTNKQTLNDSSSIMQSDNNPTPTTSYKLEAVNSPTPINPTKTVFGISLTAASGAGLYLAWRLLQTLV